jgi:hypothetical protein
MRRLALWSSAPLLFVVTFGAIYLSFRSSTPAVRGAVGSGFFLCTSLLLLWKELALSPAAKEEFGLDSATLAQSAVERIQMASSPALAAELPSSTIAAGADAGPTTVSQAVDLPSAA